MQKYLKISLVLLSLFFSQFSNAQWVKYSSPPAFYQDYVKFLNENTGYTFSDASNSLLKTTNGGVNWIQRALPYYAKYTQVINDSTVMGIGSDLSQSNWWVIKTVNSGVSWDSLSRVEWHNFNDIFL